ncbi:MAG: HlyD family efflux transporter periplasmic adaptor subunit [Candidatus Magasanikbacteria bacterium]
MSEKTSIIDQSNKYKRNSGLFGFLKNKKFLIFLAVVGLAAIVYFVYGKFFNKIAEVKKEDKIFSVTKGDISITTESDGSIVAKDGVSLSFSSTGVTIKNVYVKEGDVVKKGDKIATADTGTQSIDLQSAYANLNSARASYNEKIAGPTEDDLFSYKNSLETANANLEKTFKQNEYSIKNAENAVVTAQNNLKLSEGGDNSQIVQDAYDNLYTASLTALTNLTSALVSSDNILGIDNSMANDSFEIVLSALDSSKLNSANNSYNQAKYKLNIAENAVVLLNANSNQESILSGAKLVQEAITQMHQHYYDMQEMLLATVPIGDLSQSSLDSMRSSVNSKKSSMVSLLSSFNSSLKAVDTAKLSYDSYKMAYENALDNLEKAKTDAASSELSAKLSLSNSTQQLKEASAPLTQTELNSAKSSLANASASVQKLLYQIDQSTLKSPIDGEVVLLNGKTGDIIVDEKNSPFVTILNKDTFFVETNIEESEISKIKLNQKAYITVDALDGAELTGTVNFISLTSESGNGGVITYLVRVLLDDTEAIDIREGMSASVEFVISEANDVLILPVAAVKNVNGKPSVYLENAELKEVITGFTDGQMVEIISGLEIGQKVKY